MPRASGAFAFLAALRNSVSPPAFHPRSVLGTTPGAIDRFDWVDGVRGLLPRVTRLRVPMGAPLTISGWAIDANSDAAPRAIALVLDAQSVYYAQTGFDRSDIPALLGYETPFDIGFRSVVPTDGLVPGSHELRMYALGSDDAWYEAAYAPFGMYASMQPALDTAPGSTRIAIDNIFDAPLHGPHRALNNVVQLGNVALVTGWAIDLDRYDAPFGICAVDDLGGRWNTLCDLSRLDVRASMGANADLLGFEIAVPTAGLGRGLHLLDVQAFDAAGRRVGRAKTVELQIACEMHPFPRFARLTTDTVRAAALIEDSKSTTLLSPSRVIICEQGDVLSLAGWALAGEPPATWDTAQIFLELHPPDVVIPPFRFQAVAGFTRERPPRELPEPPRDNAWFSYDLDTADIAPRTYALRVAVVRAGRCFYARGELGSVRVVEPADSAGTARRL